MPYTVSLPASLSLAPSQGIHRRSTALEAWLCGACVLLVLALVWLALEHRALATLAETRAQQQLTTSAYGDRVTKAFAEAQALADRLEADRADLIRLLHEAQTHGISLKQNLGQWQVAHTQLASQHQTLQQEWQQYGQGMEQTLGSTRSALQTTQQTLTTTAQQAAELATAKEQVEREATALQRQAAGLANDNEQLHQRTRSLASDVSTLQQNVARLESCNRELSCTISRLESDNSRLASEASALRSELCSLKHRHESSKH